MEYKIRRYDGLFSIGRLTKIYAGNNKYKRTILWSNEGKTWRSKETLVKHLHVCSENGVLDMDWEIVEVEYKPTKPISDWMTPTMLMKMMKAKHD